MNTTKFITRVAGTKTSISRYLVFILCFVFFISSTYAQQTPGGTVISNQASATYSDGTDTFSTVSNTVTVTVSNVSGLAITPDAGSRPSVVPGQLAVLYPFTVTNTGNFSDQVRFLAGGNSIQITGNGVIAAAVIDEAIRIDQENVFRSATDILPDAVYQAVRIGLAGADDPVGVAGRTRNNGSSGPVSGRFRPEWNFTQGEAITRSGWRGSGAIWITQVCRNERRAAHLQSLSDIGRHHPEMGGASAADRGNGVQCRLREPVSLPGFFREPLRGQGLLPAQSPLSRRRAG